MSKIETSRTLETEIEQLKHDNQQKQEAISAYGKIYFSLTNL